MNYNLAYVNMPDVEHYLDKSFPSMQALEAFIANEPSYKGWTSYGVTVSSPQKPSEPA
jgi:hypothetical protein